MKTIYILRHGKSSWEHMGMSDYDRDLIPKGVKRTEKVAKQMIKEGLKPSLIISSPAKRAKHTAQIIGDMLHIQLAYDDNLYPGNSQSILNTIFSLNDDIDSVMIVGHNPGLTSIVRELMEPDYEWLPTSGLAIAKWSIGHWHELHTQRPSEIRIIEPKQI